VAVWLKISVCALLVMHFAIAVGSKLNESTTSDELVHLTAGFSYWTLNDYRLHPENGNLPQRWAAFPTWIRGATFPDLEGNEYWRANDAWVIGHQFFYETGEDHFPRLMSARAMIALFSVATGVLVFLWSRHLFGAKGALISLIFFAFSPDFLAHGALATSDVCMTFFFLAATGAWWRHLHSPRIGMFLVSAGIFGLAFVAKYSAILLLPVFVALGTVRAFAAESYIFGRQSFSTRSSKLIAIALSLIGHGAFAAIVIWAFYGFRYASANPNLPPADLLSLEWPLMEQTIGVFGIPVHFARQYQLLPEGFLYGFAYVIKTVAGRAAFLNGAYSTLGWPTFFLWTFFLKTTIPLMLASALACWLIVRRLVHDSHWRTLLYAGSPLIVLSAVYWASSLTSHLNIGHRHLLPIYPAIFIALGSLGTLVGSPAVRRGAVVATLLGWHALSSLSVAPHYLAYFNAFAGGPTNGWRHLVDSSLDWGQDLPGLKQWLDINSGGEPVFLSYFGTGEPAYYHIRARRLPFVNNFKFATSYFRLEPGIYCISASMLQQVYSPVERGEWTFALEEEFQTLKRAEPLMYIYSTDPIQRASMEKETPREQWVRGIKRYEVVRFARLCHYLKARKADATIGHSILIYRLNAEEIESATGGSLRAWSTLIEKAVVESAR
jgi:hypothetical protein